MTDLLANAVASIQLGIEDYKSDDPRRPISAVRNFYAGVLLLGKQCLLKAAPDANPMEIIASQFVPKPDGSGGVFHDPKGYRTVDLDELKERFKHFSLTWPEGNIQRLQKLRNDFEHYHSQEPHQAIQEAIASCFPIVSGFFDILQTNPAEVLGPAWEVMLEEEVFFSREKAACVKSFRNLPWADMFDDMLGIECPSCGSSLIYQEDPENGDPSAIAGKCKSCGASFSYTTTISIFLESEYGHDDYTSFKDTGELIIKMCPECGDTTYVEQIEDNVGCFSCGYIVEGRCARCMTRLTAENVSLNDHQFCGYCENVINKDD